MSSDPVSISRVDGGAMSGNEFRTIEQIYERVFRLRKGDPYETSCRRTPGRGWPIGGPTSSDSHWLPY